MSESANLTNHFLIAMPGLEDPNFSRTVTYVCEHNERGAMGIIVNRPMGLDMGDVLEQMEIEDAPEEVRKRPIYVGGPVQTERGFVLHSGSQLWDSTLQITHEISVTTSRDILEAIAAGRGPRNSLVALGYAGWGEGQLETEITANSWLSGPADPRIIFELPPEQRWQAAAMLLGVDLNLLSAETGHA